MTIRRRQLLLAATSALCLAPALRAASRAAGPREHIVKVMTDLDSFRMYFEPKHLVIEPGDTVTWVNAVEMDHNVLTYPDGFPAGAEGFESPFMTAAGERWSHRFPVEGTYEYHCLPHLIMGMHGTVVVGRPSAAGEFHKPSSEEVLAYRDKLLEYFDQEDIEQFSKGKQAAHKHQPRSAGSPAEETTQATSEARMT